MKIGQQLNTKAHTTERKEPTVPYVEFKTVEGKNGKKQRVENQSIQFRFLQEAEDFDSDTYHYVGVPGLYGYWSCGKELTPWTDKEGKLQFSAKGDCVMCDKNADEKAETPGKFFDLKWGNRNFMAHANVEIKTENDEYFTKGLKLKIGDLYYNTAKGSWKDLMAYKKQGKGSLLNRWFSIDETMKILPVGDLSKEEKKRQVEPLDLSSGFARTYEEFLDRYNAMQTANSQVRPYKKQEESAPKNEQEKEQVLRDLEDELDI